MNKGTDEKYRRNVRGKIQKEHRIVAVSAGKPTSKS